MMRSCSSLNLVSGIARVVALASWKCTSMIRFLGPSSVLNPIAGQSLWSEGTGGHGWMTDSSSIVSMCREWCCDVRIRQIELHVYAFVGIGV